MARAPKPWFKPMDEEIELTDEELAEKEAHQRWLLSYRRPSGLSDGEQARDIAVAYLYSDYGPAAPSLAAIILDILDGKIQINREETT